METPEITEALDGMTDQLDTIVHEPVLDAGQRLMLSEAQVRLAQVHKELIEFVSDLDVCDDIEAEEEFDPYGTINS